MREFFTLDAVAAHRPPAGQSWPRLGVAVGISCLLHGLLFLLPYLGSNQAARGPAGRGAQWQEARRAVAARLTPVRGAAVPASQGGPAAASASASALNAEAVGPEARRARADELLPLAAPAYYSVDQLTHRPMPLSAPNLYVPGGVARAVKGNLTLRLWISELGTVVSVEVVRSNVPEAVSDIAVAAFGRVTYVPGEINGRPVGTVEDVEISFDDLRRTIR